MFYKETEFQVTKTGKIPSDWQDATLSELSEHITKGTTPTTCGFNYEPSGVNFIKVESIDENGKFIVENVPHISEEANKALSRSILKEKDILFSIAGALGRVALVTDDILPANVNQALAIVRIKEKEKVLPEYLKYFLMGPNVQGFVKSIAIQSQQANLNLEQVRDFKVGLPPVAEQRAIVEVLGVVDSAIELADRVIAKTERLKRGLMQQLLTRGIGHTETKQTPIGQIPVSWEVTELVNLGELQYGYTASTVKKNTGVKFLRITDIEEDGSINWAKVPYCNIPKRDVDRYSLKKGDILFARIGATAGKTALVDENVCGVFASYLIRLKTKETIHPPFVFYFTQSDAYWSQALRKREGQLKKGINATMLSKFALPIPPLEEQKKIAEILSVTDHKLSLEREEKNRVENIKRGLMDLLLTGKVRIKVD